MLIRGELLPLLAPTFDLGALADHVDPRHKRPRGRPADGLDRAERTFEEVALLFVTTETSWTAAAKEYAKLARRTPNHVLKILADITRYEHARMNAALDRVERRAFGVCDGRLGRQGRCRITLPQQPTDSAEGRDRVCYASPELDRALEALLKEKESKA